MNGAMRPRGIAGARALEQNRRRSITRARACSALVKAHPDEYRALYAEARVQVDRERGALPGDDA